MRVQTRLARFISSLTVVFFLMPSGNLLAEGKTDISLMLGHRQDSLDWNIRGSTGPNILSELTWRDLEAYQLRGDIVSVNKRGVYFRGSASFGWVQSGENQDSDYGGDNRTLEWSRSVNGIDGSRMMDFKGGIGFITPFGSESQHHFVPVFGFSYHSQDLRMKDGRQVIPATGSFPGLDSSYDAAWDGFWLGLDLEFDLESRGSAYLRLEQHLSNFNAKANWNLRPDFVHPVSFEHEANGRGLVLELGWKSLAMPQNWQWGVNLGWQRWKTEPGTDRTYLTYYDYYDDTIPGLVRVYCSPYCVGTTRLNEVNWSSSQINITVNREINL